MAAGKSKQKTPKYLLPVKIDAAGRLRINGKFASKRQLGAINAVRTRKGLPKVLPLPAPEKQAKEKRSRQSKKSASTRSLRKLEVVYKGERITPVAKYVKRDYEFPVNDVEIIRSIINHEITFDKERKLVNGFVRGTTREGDNIEVGTAFMDARSESTPDRMAYELERLANEYMIVTVETYGLVFSLARGR